MLLFCFLVLHFYPILSCDSLNNSSICFSILSYSSLNVSFSNFTISEQLISRQSVLWDALSGECGSYVAQLMCSTTYPQCANDSSPILPCLDVCNQITTTCDATSITWIKLILGDNWLNTTCATLPSSNCWSITDLVSLPPPATCETYNGTACHINYEIYVRPGFDQTRTEYFLTQKAGFFQILPLTCQPAITEHFCSTSYLPCDPKYFSRRYPTLGLTSQPVVPVQPCKSICDTFEEECGPTIYNYYLVTGDLLRINCDDGRGCDWLASTNNFSAPYARIHVPCPTLINSQWLDYVNTTSEIGDNTCNPGGGDYAVGECVYPLLLKEDPDYKGWANSIILGTPCEIPCPPWYFYYSDEWDTAQSIMYLTIPSFIFCTLLVLTWSLFPTKRKQHLVHCYIGCTWVISFVLVFGFAAARDGKLMNIGCADTTKPYSMDSPSWCSFQATCLFYFSLCQSCWWLIIGYDLFGSVVLEKRRTQEDLRRLYLKYHAFCWGVPLFLFMFFLSAGGRLGSSQFSATMFCWIIEGAPAWVDAVTWLAPIGIIWLLGAVFVGLVLHKVRTLAKSLQSARHSSSQGPQVRLILFILMFLFINFWFFFFRAYQSDKLQPAFDSAVAWIGCLIDNYGNGAKCVNQYNGIVRLNTLSWYGLHLAWSIQGIILGLIWGTQTDNFILWKECIRTREFPSKLSRTRTHSEHPATHTNKQSNTSPDSPRHDALQDVELDTPGTPRSPLNPSIDLASSQTRVMEESSNGPSTPTAGPSTPTALHVAEMIPLAQQDSDPPKLETLDEQPWEVA